MARLATLFFQLFVLAVAIFGADFLEPNISFIPKFIISLPQVDYSQAELWTFTKYFLIVHFAVFFVASYAWGRWIPVSGESTANHVYTVASGFSLSTILIFVTSSASFDPNLMVGILLIHIALILTIFLICNMWTRFGTGKAIVEFTGALFSRLITVSGVMIVVLTILPGIMAKLFVSDRDFANLVTQARIYFSPSEAVSFTFYNPLFGAVYQQPVLVKDRKEEPGYLYVLERGGVLSRTHTSEGARREVLLNLIDRVGYVEVENGALGFAFHPKISATGAQLVYVYYTSVLSGKQTNIISRFDLSQESAEARQSSEQKLLTLSRETSGFHNGGALEFGPDGYLYVALGEGVHPKGEYALSETLRGGVLRLDVDCKNDSLAIPDQYNTDTIQSENYCIPSSNPFVGSDAVRNEYWALGLRNPFRMSFDATTESLWVGDVGSTKWEEVNLVRRGGHYEFPFREGYERTPEEEVIPEGAEIVAPLYAYLHTAFDRAVIGGVVYRGEKFPELQGQYVFGDNYSSKLFVMPATGERVESVKHIATANQYAQRGLSSITELHSGDLVATTLGRNTVASGEVLYLVQEGFQPERAASQELLEEYSSEEIQQIYVANCSRCHGRTGRGDGPDASVLDVAIADFASPAFQKNVNDDYLTSIIADGGFEMEKSALMPSWGHILSAGEIEGLVQYIRSLEVTK